LVGGKDGLREFYCLKSDKEIEEIIRSMLMRKLREEKYRHLKRMLGELLVMDGEERLKIGEVVDHAFLTRDKGTTTKALGHRLRKESFRVADEIDRLSYKDMKQKRKLAQCIERKSQLIRILEEIEESLNQLRDLSEDHWEEEQERFKEVQAAFILATSIEEVVQVEKNFYDMKMVIDDLIRERNSSFSTRTMRANRFVDSSGFDWTHT